MGKLIFLFLYVIVTSFYVCAYYYYYFDVVSEACLFVDQDGLWEHIEHRASIACK